VLDILLPRENGIFFLEKLREIPETAMLPVLAFSNYDDPATKQRAIDLGVLDYLLKTDYTPKDIIRKIKGYLQRLKNVKNV
jgi:DNA-binding NarL/FixJ family response regulator